jgi:NTP pyrophosphatase (non-canonical NTP hydrolase)
MTRSLFEAYSKFVEKGTMCPAGLPPSLLGATGISGEAGEVTDLLKKVYFHGKLMEVGKLREELGDVLWYIQLLCNIYDLSVPELIIDNMDKLVERYPTMHPHGVEAYFNGPEFHAKGGTDELSN